MASPVILTASALGIHTTGPIDSGIQHCAEDLAPGRVAGEEGYEIVKSGLQIFDNASQAYKTAGMITKEECRDLVFPSDLTTYGHSRELHRQDSILSTICSLSEPEQICVYVTINKVLDIDSENSGSWMEQDEYLRNEEGIVKVSRAM
jgi:hypothetical protein